MSSEAKISANRQNALRSTGPRTGRGKIHSRLNAVKYGIHATTPVLPGEDADAYREIEKANLDHFAPVGPVENTLVRQITAEQWRLARIEKAELFLHEKLRNTQIIAFLRSLPNNALAYVATAHEDEIDDQLRDFQYQDEAGDRDSRWPRTYYFDRIEKAREIDADEKGDVDAMLARILKRENTIIEALVPKAETAPQTFLDRERRSAMRIYLNYVEKLNELQEARKTITLVAQPLAKTQPKKLADANRPEPPRPDQAANQNH